jgi:integrase
VRKRNAAVSHEDAKKLLDLIPRRGDLAGLRDRALICTMLFSFAWVSAILSLKRHDFYYQGPRRWLRFHEKGGKEHVPVHHVLEQILDEYIVAAGLV